MSLIIPLYLLCTVFLHLHLPALWKPHISTSTQRPFNMRVNGFYFTHTCTISATLLPFVWTQIPICFHFLSAWKTSLTHGGVFLLHWILWASICLKASLQCPHFWRAFHWQLHINAILNRLSFLKGGQPLPSSLFSSN
jgi:hypothetical protein